MEKIMFNKDIKYFAISVYMEFVSNTLEEGDYVPFIQWTNLNKSINYLHNCVINKHILFVTCKNYTEVIKKNNINALSINYYFYLISDIQKDYHHYVSIDPIFTNYFHIPNTGINIYLLNTERRIIKYTHNSDYIINIDNIPKNYNSSVIPYIEIPDVLDQQLLKDVIAYYNENDNSAIIHNTPTKHRYHVHPDSTLEKRIDNKLSRTLFQKMLQIFYFDVKYRELYKICCYDSDANGRFHAHRDTVPPMLHRAYGMSLVLNDDYEGGELEFVEHELKLKPKANTVIVFPGTYSHKVLPVTKGKRMTIISFLCHEVEGKTKDIPFFQVKSSFTYK
jgi:predicted 2-oxoglutarate/Fe(II)-dependent dioxygenase YbiX